MSQVHNIDPLHARESAYWTDGPEPLLREVPSAEPYPVQALGPLRQAIEAVQGVTQAPVAIAAQSALAIASLAVQAFADVETLGGDRPVSIYALTIARSGERKSSCDAHLMKELRAFEMEETDRHREEHKAWLSSHALWKVQHDAILRSFKSKSGNSRSTQFETEADLDSLGHEPVAPRSRDRTVTEPTYQGLTRKFVEGQPSLGIFSDEGGQFLGSFAMSSEQRQMTLAALNDLWQGSPIRRTRQGDGSHTLFGRRLALHLMVQPGVARDFLVDPMTDDTGFLARFLVSEPASTIGTRLHALTRPDDGSIQAFGGRLRAILATPMPMDSESGALKLRALTLTENARETLIRFADMIEKQQAAGEELANLTAAASKAAEQACRIAGVLTLWRDLDAKTVSCEDMTNGIALTQFYLSEARRLADTAKVTAETERAERLRRWLLETWQHPEIMTREVAQHAPIRALRETKAATASLKVLEKFGWVVPLKPGTMVRGSCRKTAWRIVKEKNRAVRP